MKQMNRRDFVKASAAATAAIWSWSALGAANAILGEDEIPDLVAVKDGEPEAMVDLALAAVGGMASFVKEGQTVVVKPNIGWDRPPEAGANTNPLVVKRIVEHCVKAGAKTVYVFDHTCNNHQRCYANSGIEDAAKAAGATIVPAHAKTYYKDISIAKAEVLKSVKVHEKILESDVFINVPVLKHHGSSHLSVAMKNLMGIVWDRGFYHGNGLHQCIADFCLFRKPDLNIVDAYRVTMRNGPQRAREEDLELKKCLLLAKDIVAVDAAAAKVFGIDPLKVKYIDLAAKSGIGTHDLSSLKIKRITA